MDFHQLLAKMAELDTPAASVETPVQECGEPMGMTPPMGAAPAAPHNPPSLSINLNAQGMDDIESIMQLMTKVNPDMINQPEPVGMPSLTPPGPSISPLGNLDSGPLKMLPDLDGEPEGGTEIDIEPVGGDKMNGADDGVSKAQGDIDNDGDHDMDDHEMEKDQEADDEEDSEEEADEGAYDANTTPKPVYKDAEFMTKDLAGGMNKQHQQVKHSYKQGDNPMAMEGEELRSYIKSELTRRLEEAKANVAERDEGKHNNATTGFKAVAKKAAKEYGSKEAGERVAGAVRAKMAKAGKL